jgi:MFS family permease
MVASSVLVPVVPALWLLSSEFYYLLLVQVLSGLAWGGFTLSTANYLYDLRPPRADFASYAAVQASLSAAGIFCAALFGGYLAGAAPALLSHLPADWQPPHSVLLIFLVSALLRLAIVLWFIPRSVELRVRRRPDLLKVVYRISRFTPGAGVVLDWLTVTRKERD